MDYSTPPPHRPLPEPKRRSLLPLWIILGVFILLFGSCAMTMLIGGAGVSTMPSKKSYQQTVWEEDKGATVKLAMVRVEGVITGQSKGYQKSMADQTIAKIEQATEDKSIKGLLLYLNTPGGEVTASDKIYHAAMKFKKTGRPIVAYMDTVAASGGYYIACAADEIVATDTTITGSIGVIIGGLNGKEMLDKIGVKNQTFRSGPYKDTLSMMREMREDEKAYIQGLVDSMYGKFAGIVSEAREIPVETLKDGIADGRIFEGSKAKEVGLVDQTGYVEDALAALKKRVGVEKAKTMQYYQEPSITDLFSILGAKAQSEPEVKIDWGQGQFTQNLKPFVPYMVLEGY